ncbi:ParA family protein [Enterococcus faecalis]|uniref:ParA family protein n=1 Tax=Enterococcus faecalis TaxID=1351 RepID=UPI002DB96864|nr:ParA family protein [Enterococcus faecalis]MEB8146454.1 ParA family protein [Enterococcus faecalis]
MTANSIVVGNFKGGTGKSTSTQMLGFVNAYYKKRKTLLIDLDPQANASEVMSFTADNMGNHYYQENGFNKTIWNVLRDGSLEDAVLPLIDNLDLIAGNIAMSDYSDFMNSKFPNDKVAQFEYFSKVLEPLKEQYDDIFIDVPPSLGTIVQSAMYFSDYVAIMLQTQLKSLRGAADYIDYMEFFTERFSTNLGIAGIIPFMLDTKTSTESYMYKEAKNLYGENLLNTIVYRSARLIRYDETGITLEKKKNGELKQVDAKPQETFLNILAELNEHISWFEEE